MKKRLVIFQFFFLKTNISVYFKLVLLFSCEQDEKMSHGYPDNLGRAKIIIEDKQRNKNEKKLRKFKLVIRSQFNAQKIMFKVGKH